MNEYLFATGDVPCVANDVAVGIGGSQSELPFLNAESIRQSLGGNCRILGREHQGDALFELVFDGVDGCIGGVTNHGPGIT